METTNTTSFPAIGIYRFQAKLLDKLELPPYPGSMWRGVLGHCLRESACMTRQPTCNNCLLLSSCAYAQLFETPAPNADESGYRNRPHPWVLSTEPVAQRHAAADTTLQVGINLIGSANSLLPHLVHALTLAGSRGLSRSHSRYQLSHVEQLTDGDDWQIIYSAAGSIAALPADIPATPPCPQRAGLEFITPLRLKRRGHLIGAAEFTLADLLSRLGQRLDELSRYHGMPGQATSYRLNRAGLNSDAITLRWHDWARYSSRQRTKLQMGGLLGSLQISGPELAAIWPALWYGQYTHLGRGTSLGLGRYRLSALP